MVRFRARRGAPWPNIIKLSWIALAVFMALGPGARTAHARGGANAIIFVEAGGMYINHYDLNWTPVVQPPPAIYGKGMLGAWVSDRAAFYSYFGLSLSPTTDGHVFGAGGKLEFFTVGKKVTGAYPGKVNTYLAADIMYWAPKKPIPPERYSPNGLVPRFGGTLDIPFSKSGWYMDMSMYLFRFSGAIYINPGFAIGKNF